MSPRKDLSYCMFCFLWTVGLMQSACTHVNMAVDVCARGLIHGDVENGANPSQRC